MLRLTAGLYAHARAPAADCARGDLHADVLRQQRHPVVGEHGRTAGAGEPRGLQEGPREAAQARLRGVHHGKFVGSITTPT
eukprot:6746609-Pyramimonas_sp.AAC.1